MVILRLLLLSALPVLAQNASLSGLVLDPSRSAIPQAAITITNDETNLAIRLVTNAEGLFFAPSLSPGRYKIEAAKAGFQPILLASVSLDSQQSRRVQLTLPVSQLTQQIEVKDANILEESSSVSSTIDRRQINTLPLNSRNFNQLILLVGGAADNINSGNGHDFGGVAVNGNRAFSNDYLIDGVSNNDIY